MRYAKCDINNYYLNRRRFTIHTFDRFLQAIGVVAVNGDDGEFHYSLFFILTTLRFLTACPVLFVGKGFVFFVSSKVLYPGKSKTFIAFETLNHLPLVRKRGEVCMDLHTGSYYFITFVLIQYICHS